MDREHFFSAFLFMITLLLFALSLSIADNAFCEDDNFTVINVKNVVRLDSENDKSYKDFFVNYGSLKGAKIGGALKVDRRIVKLSEVENVENKYVNIAIGKLRIISVEEDVCVARLFSVEDRAENPLAVYDTAMIGDIVTPIKEVLKKAEVIILPETVLFDFDKYSLKGDARGALYDLAVKISKGGYKRVDIETHTDSIGSDEYNMKLSERRAKSILDYFVKTRRFDKKLFTAKGYGERRPVTGNKTKKDRQKNRRGVITFYK